MRSRAGRRTLLLPRGIVPRSADTSDVRKHAIAVPRRRDAGFSAIQIERRSEGERERVGRAVVVEQASGQDVAAEKDFQAETRKVGGNNGQ